MKYTVRQLARKTGISPRTLHYYDEIGLLKPAYKSNNGYRYYEDEQMIVLQQILYFRELQFSLDDIKRLVTSSEYDIETGLKDQRKMLLLQKKKIQQTIAGIDHALNRMKGGAYEMSSNPSTTITDEFETYKEIARKRWGNTLAYQQSSERTKNWTQEDYINATENWKAFNYALANAMNRGYDSPEFQALIAKQFESIQSFYDCSVEMFRALGAMYATDPKFRASYEKFRPGLADIMQKAVEYYCDRRESI